MLHSAVFAFCFVVVVYIQHVKACGTGQYECDNGRCTQQGWVCDTDNDCGDWSDERNCLKACESDRFQCANGLCKYQSWVCDGHDDCGDMSDELNCTCSEDSFRCPNGLCKKNYFRCNGYNSCGDDSDEQNCVCSSDQFRCADLRCKPRHFVCDGDNDCGDWGDEQNCTCSSDHFQCPNGRCIRNNTRCDGFDNCGDFSDEQNCVCRSDQFRCVNGLCKDKYLKCDGQNDCGDGSDEQNCIERQCKIRMLECYDTLKQSYGPHPSTQQFIENMKEIPLEIHCSRTGEYLQCNTDLETDCSEYFFDPKQFAAQKFIHSFACDNHFQEIIQNLDCLASTQTMHDFQDCAPRNGPSRGNCTDEGFAHVVDEITSCMKQSFTVRINNGDDGCTQTASDLIIELLRELAVITNPCLRSQEQRRSIRKLTRGLWKRNILSYFNFKH